MEYIWVVLLLLQIVISIQIMLMGKKVLQRIEALETKWSDVPGQAADMAQDEKLQTMERIFVQEESAPKGQELSVNHAESLINEVLSEVFSQF